MASKRVRIVPDQPPIPQVSKPRRKAILPKLTQVFCGKCAYGQHLVEDGVVKDTCIAPSTHATRTTYWECRVWCKDKNHNNFCKDFKEKP